jgi:hypothetical protein
MSGALFFHSCRLLSFARDAAARARAEVASHPTRSPQDAVTAIVMSAVAAEAFINELGELGQTSKGLSWVARTADTQKLLEFGEAYEEIEGARGSLVLKFQIASKVLGGQFLPKGENPLQDFSVLISLRNDIVHLKPRDNITIGQDGRLNIQPPRYIAALQSRGLTRRFGAIDSASWFDLLMSVELADWAHMTSENMILKILALIPDKDDPTKDPASIMKSMFRRTTLA